MPAPRCPLCNGVAVESGPAEVHAVAVAASNSSNESGVVVCHCSQSHRFVVSPIDRKSLGIRKSFGIVKPEQIDRG